MKTTGTTITALVASVTPALAAGGGGTEGISLLTALFLGFGALVIVFQLIPGLVLFAAMLKGLFSPAEEPAVAIAEAGEDEP